MGHSSIPGDDVVQGPPLLALQVAGNDRHVVPAPFPAYGVNDSRNIVALATLIIENPTVRSSYLEGRVVAKDNSLTAFLFQAKQG